MVVCFYSTSRANKKRSAHLLLTKNIKIREFIAHEMSYKFYFEFQYFRFLRHIFFILPILNKTFFFLNFAIKYSFQLIKLQDKKNVYFWVYFFVLRKTAQISTHGYFKKKTTFKYLFPEEKLEWKSLLKIISLVHSTTTELEKKLIPSRFKIFFPKTNAKIEIKKIYILRNFCFL